MVKAQDLRVGQVWKDNDGDRWHIDFVDVSTDRAMYRVQPPLDSGQEDIVFSARQLAGRMTFAGCVLETDAPIPNPAALGDLYAACHEALSLLEANHEAWLIREDKPTFARLRTALAKAENCTTNEEARK